MIYSLFRFVNKGQKLVKKSVILGVNGLIAVGYWGKIIFFLTLLDFATLTRIQLRCFNLQNDAYIINQCTSHFYWNLNGCYCRICKWTWFPISLGVNRLKMQLLITPRQCTLDPQKFNWVISGLMFTSYFNFIYIWTFFHLRQYYLKFRIPVEDCLFPWCRVAKMLIKPLFWFNRIFSH